MLCVYTTFWTHPHVIVFALYIYEERIYVYYVCICVCIYICVCIIYICIYCVNVYCIYVYIQLCTYIVIIYTHVYWMHIYIYPNFSFPVEVAAAHHGGRFRSPHERCQWNAGVAWRAVWLQSLLRRNWGITLPLYGWGSWWLHSIVLRSINR